VVALERRVGLFTELAAQRLALRETSFVLFANRYYVTMHFPAMVVLLVVVYARHAELYERVRRVLILTTCAGLVLHVTYPLAPPRMLHDLRFVDTMARYGPNAYRSGEVADFANQFAAMPSMHFAWSVIVAYAVISMFTSGWRWLVIVHPVITTVAIVITANHYWLDAIVAGAILVAVVQADGWQFRRRQQRLAFSYGAGR
jgi:PAP2 superfamily